MGYGKMVAKNSPIDLNPSGEMVKWLNGEITIDKWAYGESKRKNYI